jgi:hypothetical protein
MGRLMFVATPVDEVEFVLSKSAPIERAEREEAKQPRKDAVDGLEQSGTAALEAELPSDSTSRLREGNHVVRRPGCCAHRTRADE